MRISFPLAFLLLSAASASASELAIIGSGSGFVINEDGWVATNAHVVENCEAVAVPDVGVASDLRIDRANDLAIVRVDGSRLSRSLPLEIKKTRLGENVAALGYPLRPILSDSLKVTTGVINSLSGIENNSNYFQVSTPMQPGNSGGPLIDYWGNVVGINSAIFGLHFAAMSGELPQNVNFSMKAGILAIFLNSQGIDYKEGKRTGSEFANTAELVEKVGAGVLPILCVGYPAQEMVEAEPSEKTPKKAAEAEQKQFVEWDGYYVVGHDLREFPVENYKECRNICMDTPICQSYTYNSEEYYCHLKKNPELVVENKIGKSGIIQKLQGEIKRSNFIIVHDVDIPGNDYGRINDSDFLGCFLACDKDQRCEAFTYNGRHKVCWLKTAVGTAYTYEGAVSGAK